MAFVDAIVCVNTDVVRHSLIEGVAKTGPLCKIFTGDHHLHHLYRLIICVTVLGAKRNDRHWDRYVVGARFDVVNGAWASSEKACLIIMGSVLHICRFWYFS